MNWTIPSGVGRVLTKLAVAGALIAAPARHFSCYRACIQRNRFAKAVALDSNFLSWPIICAPTSDSYLGLGRQMAARMGLAF